MLYFGDLSNLGWISSHKENIQRSQRKILFVSHGSWYIKLRRAMCFMLQAQILQQTPMATSAIPPRWTTGAYCGRHSWPPDQGSARESVCQCYHRPAQQVYKSSTGINSYCAASGNNGIEHWVVQYEIWNTILTDNGMQFVTKFFSALCASMDPKLVITTTYHLLANGPVERFDRTPVAGLFTMLNITEGVGMFIFNSDVRIQ